MKSKAELLVEEAYARFLFSHSVCFSLCNFLLGLKCSHTDLFKKKCIDENIGT